MQEPPYFFGILLEDAYDSFCVSCAADKTLSL